MEGWLGITKERAQAFEQRWFVLSTGIEPREFFISYSEAERGDPVEIIMLSAGFEARPFMHPNASPEAKLMWEKKPMGFELYLGTGSRIFLEPPSKPKRDEWVSAINKAVALASALQPAAPAGGE